MQTFLFLCDTIFCPQFLKQVFLNARHNQNMGSCNPSIVGPFILFQINTQIWLRCGGEVSDGDWNPETVSQVLFPLITFCLNKFGFIVKFNF